MDQQAPMGFAQFIPIIILLLPMIIFNITFAKRKGKNPWIFGFVSIIPLVGFYTLAYLASLTDKSISEKIDLIISLLEERKQPEIRENNITSH